MAVTLTLTQLGAAMRLLIAGQTTLPPEYSDEVQRLLDTAKAIVEKRAPDAPDTVQNEAVVLMVAYIFDSPPATRGTSYANAYEYSGAAALVSHWVDRTPQVVG